MENNNKHKWIQATADILAKLDIAAEYRALGLDVCGTKPSAKGWIEARSFGIEDRTPSAGINVQPGPFLGRYKDFRSGETLSLFDFAATKAGKFAGDWREARKHYARAAGVELPDGGDEIAADRFEISDLTPGLMLLYAKGKAGVSWQAIRDVGGRQARYPKNLSPEKTNFLIAFPMFGSALLELEPTGWHCVPQKATGKIRQWRGKGRAEDLLDKMTFGEYGLMNVDSLKRLAEADVVNIVEGITDLLACQSVLGEWRAADPENRKHVVLSSGPCTYHPKSEWMQHFAGKEVRLWFDVGDAKNEGQVAAAVWVAALLPVASMVRNIELPLGADGKKNDLRAWLVGDQRRGLANHNYADMCAYAEATGPVEADDADAAMTQGEAILRNLGITVIGEHEGRQSIEVYSDNCRKSSTIHDVDKLTMAKLAQLVSGETVEEYVYEGKECPPDKYQLKDVKFAIGAAAADKTFYGDEKFGAGVWEHDGQLVLVKAKEVGILNGSGRIELSHVPFANGRILDCGRASGEWYDLGSLNRRMEEARDHAWCERTISEAYHIFAKWNWKQPEGAPTILVGMLIISWLQSIWRWRPQVFVTGNSNTGKTVLLDDCISKGIYGDLAKFAQKPSEAAVCQKMIRHHSKVVFIDEFEKDAHRQKILELFRTTSRGGTKIRGTANHSGVEFRIRHIPWLSAIETGLDSEADLNRYIILELNEITREKRAAFSQPTERQMRDLGERLLAIALCHFREARRLTEILQVLQFEKVPSRCVENFALPSAMLSAAAGHGDERAKEMLGSLLGKWNFEFQESQDHVNCLSTILSSTVELARGEKKNVSTLLEEVQGPDVKYALDRCGIRRVRKVTAGIDGEQFVLFLAPRSLARTILKGTDYEVGGITQFLMRFPGAQHEQQRLGGKERFTGVSIPMESVWQAFHVTEDESQELSEEHEFV